MSPLHPVVLTALLAVAPSPPLASSDLALAIRTPSGASTLVVGPGRVGHYEVIGTLSNSTSDGLAYFSTTISFSGGPLAQAANPTSAPMNAFSLPLGFSNPAGFGGTIVGGQLVQVGGAQNTIQNSFAPAPIGTVQLGVALPAAPQLLVSGDLVAPYVVGTYTLDAQNTKANVLLPGQSGIPFYKVEKVAGASTAPLQVEVHAISARPAQVSVAIGQEQYLAIDAGPANAGRVYRCLGSLGGTSPRTPLPGGGMLPLRSDSYLNWTLNNPNTTILQNSLGTLDANGRATVTFHPNARFVGLTVQHAFYLPSTGLEFVSEAQAVQVVP
jgi:hypothetical protein